MRFLALLFILIPTTVFAFDFNYKTKIWWNTIELECRSYMCSVKVNGQEKGQSPYTVKGNMAYATVQGYKFELNLTNGDYTYKKQ